MRALQARACILLRNDQSPENLQKVCGSERSPSGSVEGPLALGSSNSISKDTDSAEIGDRHSYIITVVVDINSYSFTGNSPETLNSRRRE